MKYTHILFDVDDTLFDFKETERLALIEFFDACGLDYNEENLAAYHRVNGSWWARFDRGETTIPELTVGRVTDFFEAVGLKLDPYEFGKKMLGFLGSHSILLEGALELIQSIAPFCKLYFITNGISQVQHGRLDGSPIMHYFSGVFISEEVGFSKPATEFFDYVLSSLGDAPRDKILVVGDSLSTDILGGSSAGLDTCWYNPQKKPVSNTIPKFIAYNYADIAELLLGKSEQ